MPDWIEMGPVTVGGAPSVEQLKGLQAQGFRSVIDLRGGDEKGQPVAPAEEQTLAYGMGMEYVHLPVRLDRLDRAMVEEFRRHTGNLPKPLFVHCAGGKRAAVLCTLDQAHGQGLSFEEVMSRLEQAGYALDDDPGLRARIADSIDG